MSKENELLKRLTEFFFEHAVECEEDIYQSEFVEEDSLELIEDLFSIVKSKNRTCSCKCSSKLRDNEPCCRCDSRQTNADMIRNMSDEELAEFFTTFKNTFGEEYEGQSSCLDWLQSDAE